jgi:exosortase/archaeosortase family protein
VKELSLLVWLTQLGLSVAFPLAGFILLAVWLRNSLDWGQWVIWAGLALGLICAVNGFRHSLKAMDLLSRDRKKKQAPPVAFNEHI